MVLILLSATVLGLAVAVFALYRTVAKSGVVPLGSLVGQWPFAGLMAGHDAATLLGAVANYSGFVLLCTDEVDATGAVFSLSVMAAEWDEELLIAQVVQVNESLGWLERISNRSDLDLAVSEVASASLAAMKPVQLPVGAYLRDGRLLDASSALQSPSVIANRFAHVVPSRGRLPSRAKAAICALSVNVR
ncbi:MAG: hypothetical protein ACRDNK_18440 [Solirubrobacteraceae bacterium]